MHRSESSQGQKSVGGQRGIRTPDTVARTPDFEASRSSTSHRRDDDGTSGKRRKKRRIPHVRSLRRAEIGQGRVYAIHHACGAALTDGRSRVVTLIYGAVCWIRTPAGILQYVGARALRR
jgi:hypothetical protein